jgi:ParB-like chromosome segregation protein Spo0J
VYVDPEKNLRRFKPGDKELESLKKDIQDKGLLQPVVVRRASNGLAEQGYKYELIAGYQRMDVLGQLEAEGHDVEVLIREVDADDQGVMLANVAENMRRNALSIIDLSYAIGKLRDGETGVDPETGATVVLREPMDVKEVAAHLGMSVGYVSELNKMRHMRLAIQKKIHTGEIIGALARIMAGMEEAEQDKVLERVVAGDISQNALYEALKDKKAEAKAKAKAKVKKARGGSEAGEGEGEGDGEGKGGEGGEGGTVKRSLSTKRAILILEEAVAKPKLEEGEEEAPVNVTTRKVLALFKAFLEGKKGQQALSKGVAKLIFEGD